jgi:hypothetical protein
VNLDSLAKTVLGTGAAPDPVKIRIPADHPAAPMLKHLFRTLATEERTKSGIYVKQEKPSDQGVRQMLEALRDVLAAEGIDLDQRAREILQFKHPQPIEGIMSNPLMMSQLIMGAFGGEGPVDPRVRQHYHNRAEALMKKLGEGDSL